MFYNINEYKYEQRFIEEDDIRNIMSIIFQSDCGVINHHLNEEYRFYIINNKYKYYLPNLIRHYGKVDKDQVSHSDYLFTEKVFKKKIVSRKRKSSKK